MKTTYFRHSGKHAIRYLIEHTSLGDAPAEMLSTHPVEHDPDGLYLAADMTYGWSSGERILLKLAEGFGTIERPFDLRSLALLDERTREQALYAIAVAADLVPLGVVA